MAGIATRWIRWTVSAAIALAFAAGVAALLLFLAGWFSPKVPATEKAASEATANLEDRLAPVRLVHMPAWESAVGTVHAVHETSIGSKLLARVIEVNLRAGQKVQLGDVLIRLDDTDLRAKLQQAKAAVAAADAVHHRAASDEKRYAQLVRSRTISQQQYDNAVASLRSSEADLRRAEAAVREVEASLDWATIRSPIDGTVIDKKVDVGDMVSPGQLLATLYDPKHMQMVATVRESLTHRLRVGQDIGVRLEGLDKRCSGTISEIVPEAQAASRSFQVKVIGPCPPGIYTGMFGRIFIPLPDEQVLLIPRRAVQDVGQLKLVEVYENGQTLRRAIRTGRVMGHSIEVLSGLSEGEQVVLPVADKTSTGESP